MSILKEIKYFYQRGTRGYSDRDCWDIDSHLASIIPPMVRTLKDGCGSPSKLYDPTSVNNEHHKWHEIVEEIAQGFEAAEHIKNLDYHRWVDSTNPKYKGCKEFSIDHEALKNYQDKMNRGLELFSKYFLSLWD